MALHKVTRVTNTGNDFLDALLVLLTTSVGSLMSSVLTNKNNERLTQQQQNWQEDMMHYQNLYNSPAQQIQRLDEAGINPASLGMGQGMSIQGNTSAGVSNPSIIPHIDPMSSLSSNVMSLLSGLHQGELSITESNLREYRKQQIDAETKQIEQNTALLGVNTQTQYIVNKYLEAEKTLALQEGRSRIRLNRYQAAFIDQQTQNLRYELYNLLPEQKRKLVSETDNNLLNLDYLQSLILSTEASTEKTKAETNLVEAQTFEVQAKTALEEQDLEIARQTFEKMMEVYSSQIKKMQAETNLTEEECFWKVFESIDKTASVSVMGNKVPYLRSGDRRTKRYVEKKISERYGF